MIETTMEELAPYLRGWRSYFGFCETSEVLIGLTRWVRLGLRSALWRQRKHRAAAEGPCFSWECGHGRPATPAAVVWPLVAPRPYPWESPTHTSNRSGSRR